MPKKLFSTWREFFFLLLRPALWLRKPLEISDLHRDPINQFQTWYKSAQKRFGVEFANWCCLSTVGKDEYPRGRIVLLKEYSQQGFVFYTNYLSQKGMDLENHPKASMTFYWESLQRQVRIVGDIKKVDQSVSDAYFATRPRGSQIGAWASEQSKTLSSRKELQEKYQEYEDKFDDTILRPSYWGGFILVPNEIEFWELRLSRLHDRFLYTKRDNSWKIERLAP